MYNLAVAWWRAPDRLLWHTPAAWRQPGHRIEVGCRNKCDDPDGVPRPSAADLRYYGVWLRLNGGQPVPPEDLAFAARHGAGLTPAERAELINRVGLWVNY